MSADLKRIQLFADGRVGMYRVATLILLIAWTAWLAGAATIGGGRLGTQADENACVVRGRGSAFDNLEQQIFLRFTASGVRTGDRIQIDWINPQGGVASAVPFDELPAAKSLCLMSVLPVAGYAAGAMPGEWRVRVMVNGVAAHEQRFMITGVVRREGLRIRGVRWRQGADGQARADVEAEGLGGLTTVNIARYRQAGGWEFVAHAMPDSVEGGRISVVMAALEPGQYYAILRSETGEQSPPAAFQVATLSEYRFPALAGQTWRITQGPFGSFSHWGRSIHAWDAAPLTNRLVAAMRPGTVVARDLGLGQTPRLRSFGNYVTIDHGDGEYSHYAHLKTRTFLVKTGDRVDAGQPLAEVGNSGYSFGAHLHVHVTRMPKIASMSIPFRFAELGEGRNGSYRGPIVSQNRPTGLVGPVGGTTRTAAARVEKPKPKWEGAVAFSQWWRKPLAVPKRARTIEVRHGWADPATGFDLHLISPSGKRYVRDAGTKEEALVVAAPEPGQWHVYVQAVHGGGGELPFWVDALVR